MPIRTANTLLLLCAVLPLAACDKAAKPKQSWDMYDYGKYPRDNDAFYTPPKTNVGCVDDAPDC